MRLHCVDEVFDKGEYSYEQRGTFKLRYMYQDGIYRLTGSDGGQIRLYYNTEAMLLLTEKYVFHHWFVMRRKIMYTNCSKNVYKMHKKCAQIHFNLCTFFSAYTTYTLISEIR